MLKDIIIHALFVDKDVLCELGGVVIQKTTQCIHSLGDSGCEKCLLLRQILGKGY
jgi:hypothetical protein